MKKIIKKSIVFTVLGLCFSVNVFGEIPNNSIVIGDKGFSIEYSEREENMAEIRAIMNDNNGEYFEKNHKGEWHEGNNGKTARKEYIPMIEYKDNSGQVFFYDENDGEKISFDQKFIEDERLTEKRNFMAYEYKGWIYYHKKGINGETDDYEIRKRRKDGTEDSSLGVTGDIYDIKNDWIYYDDINDEYTSKREKVRKMRLDGSEKASGEDYYEKEEKILWENENYKYALKDDVFYRIGSEGEKDILIELVGALFDCSMEIEGNLVYAENSDKLLLLDMKNDTYTEYDYDLSLEACIDGYLFVTKYEDGEENLYRIKEGDTNFQLVKSGGYSFVGKTDGWIYFESENTDSALDLFRCKIDGRDFKKVAKNVDLSWKISNDIFFTDELGDTYRFDEKAGRKRYIGKEIEMVKQFTNCTVFEKEYSDEYYIINKEDSKLKEFHKGYIVGLTEKDGYIYYFDEPDYYSVFGEEDFIMSFYKYDINKGKEEIIGKDIDCAPYDYLSYE